MTPRTLLFGAAALGLVQYLTVSFLFDARELVPASLDGIGALAPLPLVVVAAALVLRATATDSAAALPAWRPLAPVRLVALVTLQLVSFAAFLGVSFLSKAAPSTVLTGAWVALAATTAASLAALALGGAALGTLARRLGGPLGLGLVVGVSAWGAGQGTGELWHPLARATLLPIATAMRALFSDAVVDVADFVVGTERFSVRIEPVCSGYEGMGLVAVLLGAYVWSFRAALRFPHALALPVLAALLAFIANLVRITALIAVGTLGAPDVAMGGFHSKAGWLLFSAIALGVVSIARRAAVFQRSTPGAVKEHGVKNPSAAFLMPLLTFTAAGLVVGLASDGGLNHLEWTVALCGVAALAWFRTEVRAALFAAVRGRELALSAFAGALVCAAWLALSDGNAAWDAAVRAERAAGGDAWWALWVGTRLVVSIAIVPVVEELAFRGFLMRRLVSADFDDVSYREVTPIAVVASSLVFGVLHGAILAGFCAGLVFSLTVWVTGSLRAAVVAHAVANALLAIVVLVFGRWALWQ